MNHTAEVAAVLVAPPCDMCDYKAASEKGLKTHKRMKHGPPRLTPPAATPSSPETLRGPGQMRSALNTSPSYRGQHFEKMFWQRQAASCASQLLGTH